MPWTASGEKVLLNGHRRVVSRHYQMPDGRESDWDILAGGRTVAVVAVTDDGQVVLVRQFRPGPERVLAELPGGNVSDSEEISAAASRELLEETGFQASSVDVIGSTWLAAYSSSQRFTAVARGCRRVAEPKPDRNEFVEPVVVSMSEFLNHALGGALTDQDIALRGLVALGILAPTADIGEGIANSTT